MLQILHLTIIRYRRLTNRLFPVQWKHLSLISTYISKFRYNTTIQSHPSLNDVSFYEYTLRRIADKLTNLEQCLVRIYRHILCRTAQSYEDIYDIIIFPIFPA